MLNYIVGDLFKLLPYETPVPKFIPHIVNNAFGFGSGFVVPLMTKWPETRVQYMAQPIQVLGHTQFVKVKEAELPRYQIDGVEYKRFEYDNIWVAHMCAQNNTISASNPKPIKYAALAECMKQVAKACAAKRGEIWAPMFGSIRAGGNWSFIEELIDEIWGDISVTICKFDENEK
jgi:hypothetical protein